MVQERETVLKVQSDVEIAICWFDEEQWRLLKELDPDGTDESYEDWRYEATKAVNILRSEGSKVRKIHIHVSEFIAWCKKEGLEPVSSARAEYAAFLLRNRNEGEKT